jgi:hypothetical protein
MRSFAATTNAICKTTSVAPTRTMKKSKTYIKWTRFGAKGRTPVALNKVASRARGKKTWMLEKMINQT